MRSIVVLVCLLASLTACAASPPMSEEDALHILSREPVQCCGLDCYRFLTGLNCMGNTAAYPECRDVEYCEMELNGDQFMRRAARKVLDPEGAGQQ